jgi:hypothetical protein
MHFLLVDKDKNGIFVGEEPTGALAYTDFSKPSPVLEGEDAERFLKNMEEAEERAKVRSKQPKTKVELENELSSMKIMYEYEERVLNELKKKIEDLEKEINAKTEEK